MTFNANASMTLMWRTTFVLIATVALLASCDKTDGKAADPAAAKAPAAAAAAAVDTAGATKADCDAYAKSLCGMAGEKSGTCTNIKDVLALLPPAACKTGLANIEHSRPLIAAKGKVCDELVKKLCGDLGTETETCKMVTEKTKQFPPDRCEQMMKDYGKVLAQLKQMEAANKPLTADKIAAISKPGAGEHGPQDAKATLVEFSDFQCPYCSRAANASNELKKKYGDKVRIIFRQFPLSFHKEAHLAGQASLAAKAEGKFWEYHDLLFANQKALKRPDLEKYAKQLGLNMAKFKKALDDGTYKAAVDADLAVGKSVAVQGTPTMFLNGKRVSNPGDASAIGKEIDAILAK